MLKLIIFVLAVVMCAADDIASINISEQESCDSLVTSVIDHRDKNLKNYIVRFDLPTDYAKRNESNEMCFNYLSKLLARIDYYKEAASAEEDNAQDARKRAGKPRKNNLKSAFHFKY